MDFNTSVAAPSPAALEIKPPVSQSPLEMAAQFQDLQNAPVARQLAQQKVEEGRRALDMRQAINEAYRSAFSPQPDGSMRLDEGKLTQALATANHGEAIPAIMEAHTKYQNSLAELAAKKQEIAGREQDAAGALGATVTAANHDPALFHTLMTSAIHQGAINQEHYAPMDQAVQQALQEDPSGERARELVKGIATQFVAGSAKQRQLANETTTAQANSAKTTQEVTDARRLAGLKELSALADPATGAVDPAEYGKWREKYKDVAAPDTADPKRVQALIRSGVAPKDQPEYDINQYKAKAGLLGNGEFDQYLAQYARSVNKTPATLSPSEFFSGMQKYAEFKVDPTMRALAITQKTLADTLARAQLSQMPSDADYQTLAKSLIDHSLSPTQFNELKAGRMGQISPSKVFLQAKQIDPNFSLGKAESEFKAYEKTEADFTSGKEAGLVRSNNNAIEHLALLEEARKALKNNDLPALSKISSWLGTQLGGDAATTFDHIASRVGDEVTKAFIPGGGSAGERQESGKGSYSSKMGDAQISSNIRADLSLMDSQQRHLVDQYKRGTYGQGGQQLFTPEAQAARDRMLGGQPSAGGTPPRPASIPANAKAQFNPKTKAWRYSTDEGKTWQTPR